MMQRNILIVLIMMLPIMPNVVKAQDGVEKVVKRVIGAEKGQMERGCDKRMAKMEREKQEVEAEVKRLEAEKRVLEAKNERLEGEVRQMREERKHTYRARHGGETSRRDEEGVKMRNNDTRWRNARRVGEM